MQTATKKPPALQRAAFLDSSAQALRIHEVKLN